MDASGLEPNNPIVALCIAVSVLCVIAWGACAELRARAKRDAQRVVRLYAEMRERFDNAECPMGEGCPGRVRAMVDAFDKDAAPDDLSMLNERAV